MNDVAVVGCDDVPQAGWPSSSLSTIRQPINQMVSAAVSELIAAIEGNTQVRKIRVAPAQIVRGTTR